MHSSVLTWRACCAAVPPPSGSYNLVYMYALNLLLGAQEAPRNLRWLLLLLRHPWYPKGACYDTGSAFLPTIVFRTDGERSSTIVGTSQPFRCLRFTELCWVGLELENM